MEKLYTNEVRPPEASVALADLILNLEHREAYLEALYRHANMSLESASELAQAS